MTDTATHEALESVAQSLAAIDAAERQHVVAFSPYAASLDAYARGYMAAATRALAAEDPRPGSAYPSPVRRALLARP